MASGPAMDLGAGRIWRVRPRHQRLVDRDQDLPGGLFVQSAELRVPANAQTPIAADIVFSSPQADGPLHASLDWRRSEGEEWTITVETSDGRTSGSRTAERGCFSTAKRRADDGPGEYPDIYRTFVDLIDERRSLVDVAPFRLVADCLLVGKRTTVEPVNELMEQVGPPGISSTGPLA